MGEFIGGTADVEFNDDNFRPANPRKGDAEVSASDGGNARPTADLAEVDGHNDGFGEELQVPWQACCWWPWWKWKRTEPRRSW